MPTVYLRKDLYDKIVRMRCEVNSYINKLVEKALQQKETVTGEGEAPKAKPKSKSSKGG